MKAEGFVHPELHGKWGDVIAVPIWRPGNGADGEMGCFFHHGLPEGLTASDGTGLLAGPSADAACPGAGIEIGIRIDGGKA